MLCVLSVALTASHSTVLSPFKCNTLLFHLNHRGALTFNRYRNAAAEYTTAGDGLGACTV
jgi:hypothetical protein